MDWSRNSYRRRQQMLYRYTIALAVLSVSILLMPAVNGFKNITKLPMYLVGLLFWASLISTIGMAIKINRSRQQSSAFNSKYPGLRKLALIHFFQNKPALIIDIMMFASLIVFVFGRFRAWNTTILFLLIAVFVFSFGMHCMLNGINYIYIKQKQSVRRG